MISRKWIHSPLYDFTFILSGIWLSALISLVYFTPLRGQITLWLFLLVSCGHIIAPIWTVLKNDRIYSAIKNQERYVSLKMWAFFLAPICLMSLSAYFFLGENDLTIVYMPVFLVFMAYFIFNSWHFGMQNYGVIRTYKKIQNIKDSPWIDLSICLFVQLVILTVVWFNLNIRNDFIRQFGFSTRGIFSHDLMIVLMIIFATLFGFIFWNYRKSGSVLISYFHFFLVQFMVMLNPIFFTLTVYSATHHFQEFGLNSIINKKASSKFKTYQYMFFLMIVSLLIGFLHIRFAQVLPNITLFGRIDFDSIKSRYEYLISCLFFGFWMGVNFLHFYTSRLLYRTTVYEKLPSGKGE